MKVKSNGLFWLALSVFSLMGQVAWVVENMYFNVFIYKMFAASPADISAMVSASAIVATVTTVFMGALSDKIGKRKLFMCFGYILWGVSILSFVFLREDIISRVFSLTTSATALCITLTITLDCIMTFFGSTANDAAFNAWLTDSTDSSNRGAAEGINAMMPLVSILVVFGGFMFFDLSAEKSWSTIFLIIGLAVIAIGILGFFIIKEPPIKPSGESYFQNIIYGFKPKTIKQNPALYIYLLTFIIFNIAIQIFMPYLIIYYEVSLKMSNYVLIMAPAIIIASVVTAFWGKLYDKKGFRLSGSIGLCLMLIGFIILYFTSTTLPVFIGSLLMMSGYLSGMAVFGAVIRDNTPSNKAGRLQGVRIFSQVLLPGVIGPFIGKLVLKNAELITGNDGTTSFVPNANIFLAAFITAALVLPFFFIKSLKKQTFNQLETPFEKELKKTDIPFADYPRPNLKRDSFLCLNGKWDFEIVNKKGSVLKSEILVPFAPESKISGVGRIIKKNETLIYKRSFNLSKDFLKDKLLLHFGAVDQYCEVFVNQKSVGKNVGGYLPFSFDITDYIKLGQNEVEVRACDPLDISLPYGKQTRKRGGMWYTNISGIWQTVWLESVCKDYISSLKITPSLDSVLIEVTGGKNEKTLDFEGKEYTFCGDSFKLEVKNPKLWTPDRPHLYDFKLCSGEDMVESYFSLRTVSVIKKNNKALISLNGQPIFCNGLLDQGYFSDGIFLPACADGFKNDILTMKKCGFNMLRKHIKLEPDLFYYYCDKYGMLVFQDMINNGKYSFLVDTALPTVFLKKGISHTASKSRRLHFEKNSKGIIENLYNHPSVVYYTIFNEGWGQFDADNYYKKLKSLDSTRIYDTTSGWFHTKLSDVISEHIYFKPIKLKNKNPERPLVLSEFGGYVYKLNEHSFNLSSTMGYKFFKTKKDFFEGLTKLYKEQIIPQIKNGLSACVLTQISDVEDETNGLLTYDRAVLKVDEQKMAELSNELYQAFKENL